jgi:hypothetical protein
MTGLFGGEGFIMQKLDGDGWVFVQMGGTVVERELAPGEELHVDTGCLAAFTPSVDFDLEMARRREEHVFGGEGLFFAAPDRPREGVDPVAAVLAAGRAHAGGGRPAAARTAARARCSGPSATSSAATTRTHPFALRRPASTRFSRGRRKCRGTGHVGRQGVAA